MEYTTTKIEVTRGKVQEAERRTVYQRKILERLPPEGELGNQAQALLLIMEQSLIAMTRFLKTLEKQLAESEGLAGRQKMQTRVKLRRPVQAETEAPDEPTAA